MRRSSYLERVAGIPPPGMPVLRPLRGMEPRLSRPPAQDAAPRVVVRSSRTQSAGVEASAPEGNVLTSGNLADRSPSVAVNIPLPPDTAAPPIPDFPADTLASPIGEPQDVFRSEVPHPLRSALPESLRADAGSAPVSRLAHEPVPEPVPPSMLSKTTQPQSQQPPSEQQSPLTSRTTGTKKEPALDQPSTIPAIPDHLTLDVEPAHPAARPRPDAPAWKPASAPAGGVRIGSIEVVITPPLQPAPHAVPVAVLPAQLASTSGDSRMTPSRLTRGFTSIYGFRQE
jgi:hypothetical protein